MIVEKNETSTPWFLLMTDRDPFQSLAVTIDHLLSPAGCQWDREQTVETLSRMLFEEVCEMIDSVKDPDPSKLADELGDVFITAIFLAKAAENEKKFAWVTPLEMGKEKLIRRHPHIFGEEKSSLTNAEVMAQWEQIKKKENPKRNRLDNIPSSLPALAMMQKILKKLKNAPDLPSALEELGGPSRSDEDVLAKKLMQLIAEAEKKGIHAENALRQFCHHVKEIHKKEPDSEPLS